MIPRYQRIAYWSLVAAIVLMSAVLIRGCQRNQERIAAMRDQSPIAAPTDTASEQVTLAVAHDADGSITFVQLPLALPEEPSLRARILLARMLGDAALGSSDHPLPTGPAVSDVFLLALPIVNPGDAAQGLPSASSGSTRSASSAGGQLAVVNLTKAFADQHPSGIETEDLTLRSILATLHANLSQVEQVRFLVDGQSRDTLAGHADLTRPYQVVEPARSIHVLAADGSAL